MGLLDGQVEKFQPTGKQKLAAAIGQAPVRRKRRNETLGAKGSSFVVTTYRMRRDQYAALKQEALNRALKQGNKPDASAIVREAVDRLLKLKG